MSGAKEASPKKASSGEVPHDWAKEESITTLGGCPNQPQWSFSKANRFKWQSSTSQGRGTPPLEHSRSAPTLSTELPAVDSLESTTYDGGVDAGASGGFFGTARGSTGAFDTTWGSFGSDVISTRLDTSIDRFEGPRDRAALPKPKSYPPAPMMGGETALTKQHAPLYSFGGGKSRMSDLDGKKDKKAVDIIDEDWERKKKAILQAREEEAQRTRERLENKKRSKLSRGFGSAVRLRTKGSFLELPTSPGPAAYELARECDQIPEWLNTSITPWGRRTGTRPEMKNPTFTDTYPGGYIADHPFHATHPSPLFGHPFKPIEKENFTGPGQYPLPSSVGAGLKYGIGPGKRPPLSRETIGPGPAGYYPPADAAAPHIRTAFFGYADRPSPGDGVDPDEPPGPGAHTLKDTLATRPNPGLPKEEKLKKTPGLGPQGIPSPGDYKITMDRAGKPITIAIPVKRATGDEMGDPCKYDANDRYPRSQQGENSHASLRFTAPRKGPFDVASSGSDASSAALLQRAAAAAAAQAAEGPEKKKQKEKEAIAFQPAGPRYSLGRFRPEKTRKPYCKAMYGRAASTPVR